MPDFCVVTAESRTKFCRAITFLFGLCVAVVGHTGRGKTIYIGTGDMMKVFVLTRRMWRTALSVCAAAAVTATAAGCLIAAQSQRLLPIYCVEDTKKRVAITFDAAWGADDVDDLIQILAEYDAPATIFAVGEWVEKYPDAVKKLAQAGHRFGNHSDAHKHLDDMSDSAFRDDVQSCNARIEKITGQPVTLYRGPYGEYNNRSVAAIEDMGMYYIQWDCDSLDWKPSYTVDTVVKSALKNVKPGSIMLLHIGAEPTTKALPIILQQLKKDGYELVLVEDLILKKDYVIDHTGRQCAK